MEVKEEEEECVTRNEMPKKNSNREGERAEAEAEERGARVVVAEEE